MNTITLPDRAVLSITGVDAQNFLQGLISNDIRKATQDTAIFSALLSPQGRFLFDFFIIAREEGFLFDTFAGRAAELKKRLLMYRLRSKVQIIEMPDWRIVCGNSPVQGATTTAFADPRHPALGWRSIVPEAESRQWPPVISETGHDSYESHRLGLGVPDGAKDLIVDRSILLEYGYDELHGVDFTKGCYVGQEVTARSKHRAGLRKFIHQVVAAEALPPCDTPVMAGVRAVGELRSSACVTGPVDTRWPADTTHIGLAHLNVEEVRRAMQEGTILTTANIPLTAKLPEWCATNFAEPLP